MYVHRTYRYRHGLRSFGLTLCLGLLTVAVLLPGSAGATVGEVTKQSTAILPAPGELAPSNPIGGSSVFLGGTSETKNRVYKLGEALTETELSWTGTPERTVFRGLVQGADSWLWAATATEVNVLGAFFGVDPGHIMRRKAEGTEFTLKTLPTAAKSCDETWPIEFGEPRSECGLSLSTGPENTVWYAQYRYDYNGAGALIEEIQHLGRIKVKEAGQPVTEYNLPTKDVLPRGLTEGPGGVLWFRELLPTGEPSQNRFAKAVLKEGKLEVTEYPMPAGYGTGPLAPGSDGNMYMFASSGGAKALRIKPSGETTLVKSFAEGENPGVPALGPDGNLWFVEGSAKQIGRMTMAGTVTHYLIPNASNCTPNAITRGWSEKMIVSETCTGASKGRFSVVSTK